jgi:hypothetical protein
VTAPGLVHQHVREQPARQGRPQAHRRLHRRASAPARAAVRRAGQGRDRRDLQPGPGDHAARGHRQVRARSPTAAPRRA